MLTSIKTNAVCPSFWRSTPQCRFSIEKSYRPNPTQTKKSPNGPISDIITPLYPLRPLTKNKQNANRCIF